MKPARAWVRLQSGRRLNLLEPDPASWTDSDLAIGLSRTYRWGGHSCWVRPLSVAQHSLLVLVLRQKLRPLQPLSQAEALRELLHDADEGLLSYDPISPVKPHLGEDFRALATSLQAAVRTRYRVAAWDDENYAVHKQADRLAAASEAVHVAGWSYAELRETLEIDIPPLSADPLPLLEGMQPWEPWPARTAAALFLSKIRELTADNDEGGGVTTDLAGCIARTRTLAFLAEAFNRLPPRRRARCRLSPSGDGLQDLLVAVEQIGGDGYVEGLLVDAERDSEGAWDFEAPFKVFTDDQLSGDRVNPSTCDIRNPATLRSRTRQNDGSVGRFSARQGRAETDDEDAGRGVDDAAASRAGLGHAADCGGGRLQPRDGAAVFGCGCLDAVPGSDPPWPAGGTGCLAM